MPESLTAYLSLIGTLTVLYTGLSPRSLYEGHQRNGPELVVKVPTDAKTVTYANADLTKTIKVPKQYGVRLLTTDETRAEMPQFPL